jgi:tetratricopeptide (TPR) repeat protein
MKTSPVPTTKVTEYRTLDRLNIVLLVAILSISSVFGAYYFWDRYIHPGDMSPIDLGISHLEQVVQSNPDDKEARLSLIQYYLDNENYPEAIEQSQQVLNAYPDNPGALLLLGIAYTKTDKNQLAIDTLERFSDLRRETQAIEKDTILETSLYYIGQNYLLLNQHVQAIEALSEALEIDRTDADAMYLLGNAFVQGGQYGQAVDTYLNAIRFVPDFAEAYRGLSVCYTELNQPDMALYAQGMEAFSERDYNQARQFLEQAAAQRKDVPELFLGLSMTYEQLGEDQLAKETIKRVLELDPHNIAAQTVLMRIQSKEGSK